MNIASLEDTAAQMGQISKLMRLLASSGITSEHLQRAIDNKSARINLVQFLNESCPKVDYTQSVPKAKRVKKGELTFDEATYFQTRTGLWADDDLGRYVGLKVRPTRSHSVLKLRVLLEDESEATMFGQSGSDQYANTLATAVDLVQIGGKIDRQWNGEEGELLTDGRANIFPVIGSDGALRVVNVNRNDGKWNVDCDRFNPDCVWDAGNRVFSN